MRACDQGLRPSVRSTMMIGAAGAAVTFGSATAIADSTNAKPPPAINKYLPYTQIGGTSGDSMSTGGITLFIPAWQALNQLLFIKVGGDLQSSEGSFSTFGVGYRQKIAPTWIIGGFGNYDHTHTKLNDDFNQFVFGAELLNPNWEFHGNAYVADTGHIDLIKNSARLEVDGNDIAIVREQEAPYSGFDGSGGYRAFKTPGTDGRLYAGGFYFKTSDKFDTKPITGPKAGFEFNVYDLDFIGPQSRLQVQGEARHDSVRGNTGFVGINLRVPFNIDTSGPGAQALDELDRRMVDDPQTTGNVLTQSEFNKPEPVIIYGGTGGRTQPTNTIFYIDNSTGRGSYPNPTTFSDATTRGGDNALIVITTKEGDVSGQGALAPGDMVIGAGTTLTIKGAETGYKFTHTFAPGERDAVLNVAAGRTAITLASNNALYNFAIHGPFGTAIAGNNVGLATIRNLTIQGDGSAGQKGIALTQDGAAPLDLLMTDTSVSGVGGDGISIATHLDGASTLTEKIALSNVSVSSAGGNGVTVSTQASGGAQITQDITLDDVSVAGAGGIGIGIAGFAEGGGSQLTQTGAINNASVSGAGGVGIAVYGYTSGGGALTQNVSIDPTTVNTSGYALAIGANAVGGTLNQTVTVTDFSGSGDNSGIEIYAYGDAGASVYQTAMLSNVSFDAVGHDGVRIFAHSNNGAYVHQGVEFDGLTLNGAGLYDIAVEAYADGGSIHQTAIFNNLTINGSAQSAVNIYGEAGGGGEGFAHVNALGGEYGGEGGEGTYALDQNVLFNAATINTHGDGFYAGLKTSYGESATQYVSFSNDSTITSYDGGVTVYASASDNSVLRQRVHLPQVTLIGSIGGEGGEGGYGTGTGGGIRIETHSYSGSNVHSYTLIDSASISYAESFGVAVAGYAEGGFLIQTVKLNNANITNYYATGISVYGIADSGATLNQDVFFDNVTVNGSGNPFAASLLGRNGGHAYQYVSFADESGLNSTDGGVSAYAEGANYGAATQTLMLPYIDVNGGFGNGIFVGAYAYGGGAVHQGVAMGSATASGHVIGLDLDATAGFNGTLVQIVTADNFTATGEGSNGIYIGGDAGVGAHLSQHLTIGMATLTNEGANGLYATLSAQDGANALQAISLPNANTDSSGTGIGGHVFANSGGIAEQDFGLSDISAQYEVNSGISLYAGGYGTATQHVNVEVINARHDGGDGIYLHANATGGTIGQYVTVNGGTFDYDANGLHAYLTAVGGTAHQQFALTNATVDYNLGAGLRFFSHGDGYSSLYQTVVATNSHFYHNDGAGILANNGIVGGANLHQGIALYASSVYYNLGVGVGVYTIAYNAHSVHNNVIVSSSDVSHNEDDGVAMSMTSSYTFVAAQYFMAQGSTFNINTEDGVGISSSSQGDTVSYQGITSANDTFSNNMGIGLREAASDVPGEDSNTGILSQVLSSTGDTFTRNYIGGISQNIADSVSDYLLQSSTITGANVVGGHDGIFVGAQSQSSNSVISRNITDTNISDFDYGGVELRTSALGAGRILDNTTIADVSTLTGFGVKGISSYVAAKNGGFVDQYLTLTSDNTSGANIGVSLTSAGYGGTALQHATIDGLVADGNGYGNGNGFGLVATASAQGANSIAAEYLHISNSEFNNNNGTGLSFVSQADGNGAVTGQSVSIANVTANGNATGISFNTRGTYGGAANQYGHLDGVTVTNNSSYGVLALGYASHQGFAAQTVILTNTSDGLNTVSYNTHQGIAAYASAVSAGNVEQNIGIYNTDVSHNGRDGITLSSYALGYVYGPAAIYYSHVSQNDIIGNDQITSNVGNGIAISVNAGNYARIDPFVYAYGDTITNNGKAGISETSTAGAFAQLYGHFYVVNSHVDGNTGAGFFEHDYAAGLYSTNILTTALVGTDFDNNGGAGAYFYAGQNYGPGGFGVTLQTITIQNSTFRNNTGSGLEGQMRALGNEGRAEQHFNISGSIFDANTGDGISLSRYAGQGVYVDGYPCTSVQSTTGGCAFDRQTALIFDSDISNNGGDGIYIGTTLNHYAAAYAQSGRPTYPTLYFYNTTVNANGGNGLHLVNHVDDHSYLYQGVIAVGSHFDNNGGSGILGYSEVSGNSSMKQGVLLYASSANYNMGSGIYLKENSSDASVYDYITAIKSHFDHNAGSGISNYAFATGGKLNQLAVITGSSADYNAGSGVSLDVNSQFFNTSYQGVSATYSDFSHNGADGVGITRSGHLAYEGTQKFIGHDNTFNYNTHDGLELKISADTDIKFYQFLTSANDTFNANGYAGLSETAQNTFGPGFIFPPYSAAQLLSSTNDTLDNNQAGGIQQTLSDQFGSYAAQYTTISGDTISGGQYGIVIRDDAETFRSLGAHSISNTTVNDTSRTGIILFDGGISVDSITYTDVTKAGGNGIQISSNGYQLLTLSNDKVMDAGEDGISISFGGSYQKLTLANDIVRGAGQAGIYDSVSAFGYKYNETATLVQNIIMSDVTVTGSGGVGVELHTLGGPYSTILQHVYIDKLTSTGNSEGLYVEAVSNGLPPSFPTKGPGPVIGQYIQISNSHFDNNAGDGAYFHISTKYGSTGLQSVSIANSTANGNGADGFHFNASAQYSSANQYAHLDGISASTNTGDGIAIYGNATQHGFTAQTILLTNASDTGNTVSHNGSDGIRIVGNASTAGNVEQGIGLYYTNVTGNQADGVSISGSANGSLVGPSATYYSHVAQNVNAYHDSFSHNGERGVAISNVASGGAQINSFAYFYADKFDKNAGDGLHVYSHAGAGSNIYDDIYVVGGSASHNGANGIAIDSYADQSTYLIQNIAVIGAVANHNGGGESGGNGFVDNAHAQGQYSLNGQYITLANSTFDGNNGAGAVLEAAQTYGPGPFGVARQYLTVVGSDFSHNTHDGLYAITDATGNQGRAEQHFTIAGSKFDNNGGDGIHLKNYIANGVLTYGTNSDGTYPLTCNYVQGADGGCAFVRQTVDIANSDISHNAGDGIYISTVLNHYAAAYNVGGRPLYTPTLYLNGVTVDHNGANGLHITNYVGQDSYEYQYIVAVNSHFDHNQGYGILSGSGVGANSTLYQKIVLASLGGEGGRLSSVDNNGLGGIDIETGAGYSGIVSNALVLAYTDVSHNGGNGVTMRMTSTDVTAALQSFASIGSNFANNSGDGVSLYARSAGDGLAAQIAQSYYDTFTKNGGAGLTATAFDNTILIGDALHTSVIAAQSITSVGDTFSNNAGGGISQTERFEAPLIAYQKLYVSGDVFNANGTGDFSGAQISSEFQSGSGNGTVYRTVLNSSFAGGEGNAIEFDTSVTGFAIDRTVVSGNTIHSAGGDGVKISGAAYNYGTLYQSIVMDNDHIYGSIGDGVDISGIVFSGGEMIQSVAVSGLISNGNGGDGFSLLGRASGAGSILAQYATIAGSTFDGNNGAGLSLYIMGDDALSVASQQAQITGSTFTHNGVGIEAQARAFAGASANQYTLLTGDTVDHNFGDGIRILSDAETQGFVAQGFNFNGTGNALSSISHNGGDGIYISARAVNGGEVEQNVGVYYANITHNAGDGININTYAQGYYPRYTRYYSHISQNIGVGYGSIAHNGGDGVHVVNSVGPGDGLNQYIGFYGETISSNAGKGIYEHSVAEAYVAPHTARETYLYSSLYMTGGSVTKNGGESGGGGIDVRSYADGTTYMIQHIAIAGAHIDGNHGDGLSVTGSARGLYSLNIQYITLAGSTFDHNTGNGARVYGHQFYGGYGSFGAVLQYVTVQQSDFSHNGGDGLGVGALATDEQGRVGQTISISGSTFDGNSGDGIRLNRTAGNGTYLDGYPCTSVQGLYGGCAFVRQTVQIVGSDISNNKGDGLYIGTNVSNYGTVYSVSGKPKNTPTVVIYDTTIDHNGGDGLHLVNNASGNSDIYQYVVAIDSHFDHNAGYGIEAHNNITGGSTLFQNIVLYHYVQPDLAPPGPLTPMSVGNNGKGGVHIDTHAGAGATVYEGLTLIATDISHNTGDGVNVSLNANGALKATQFLYATYSTFVGNTGDGIHVSAYGVNGSNLAQTVISRNNYFARNGGTGLYVGFRENGVAGATQHVESYFDSFRQNGSGIGVNTDFISGTGKLSSGVLIGSDSIHGGKYGINVSLAASNGANVAGFQKISYSSVSNVSGDGIGISLTGDSNAIWSETAQILGNGIQYAVHDGIAVNFSLTNYAHLQANPAYRSPGVLIQDNTITGHSSQGGEGGNYATGRSHDGIYVGLAVGSGGSIYETGGEQGQSPFAVAIDNNKVSYVRHDGIEVATHNTGGTLDEASLIYGNSVYYATHSGIVVSHTETGGQSRVGESIHDNHVYADNFFGGERGGRTGNEAGIEVTAAGNGGTLQDFASIYSNTTEGHNIGVVVEVRGDQGTRQSADIHDNQIDRNEVGIYGFAGGSAYQHVFYASNNMSFNGTSYDFAYHTGATQILN
jgi:hypothetical protein